MDSNEKLQAEQRKRYLNDLRFVMDTVEGRNFLRTFMEENAMFRSSFNANSERLTVFNEGQRNVILKLFSDMVESSPQNAATILTQKKEIIYDVGSEHNNNPDTN